MPSLSSLQWAIPLVGLGLALLLSMTVALVYVRLHKGMAINRPFAQTLAVAGVVSAIIVLSIGDNIARGIGLVGALTVIRFRSDLKDPRDLIFAFAALATGVAAGAHAWAVAVGGTATFLGATALVAMPWFARTESFDAVLSLRTTTAAAGHDALAAMMRHYCDAFALVRVRQVGRDTQEQAYQVRLKQEANRAALVNAMKHVPHVEDALLVALDNPNDVVTNR